MGGEPDDFELLDAWRAGDRERGNALFRRHVVAIARFFRTKIPDHAEDLTQTTFLAVAESKGDFRGQSSFRAFLFGVARNQLLMHLRARGRAQARFDPLTWSAADAGASPAKLAWRSEQQALVATALQRLPVDTQVTLELHYFEGLPLGDIASVLGEPLGTVKSRLSRGRDLLREKLEEIAAPRELLESTVGDVERWARSLSEVAGGREPER